MTRCFFARAEALWNRQQNHGLLSELTGLPIERGDDFWQFNSYLGYRFRRNLAEISVGLLNMTGRNYNLNPLNLYDELPRDRTLLVRCRLNF